ncbi:MAG: hypothetical protein ACI4HI_03380 [Lachnospiraceae bacterium]
MDYNEKLYKQTLDKLTLDDAEKEKAKRLFTTADSKNNPAKITKFLKPAIAVACAIAILITSSAFIPNFPNAWFHTFTGKKSNENSCTLTVYAQELTKNERVSLKNFSSIHHYGGLLDRENKLQTFDCEFPVTCKGKNIKTITYSIDGPAYFENRYPEGHSILTDGINADLPDTLKKQIEEDKPYHDFSDFYENKKRLENEYRQYQSFTVNYQKQHGDCNDISIEVRSDLLDTEKKQLFSKKYDALFDRIMTINDQKQMIDFLLEDLVITCTITFDDGSIEEKQISLESEIDDEDPDYESLSPLFRLK